MHKHLRKMTLLLCLFLMLTCVSCARKLQVLRSDQMTLIIPKGTQFKAVFEDKLSDYVAEEDMACMHKGYLLKLQQEANAEAWK